MSSGSEPVFDLRGADNDRQSSGTSPDRVAQIVGNKSRRGPMRRLLTLSQWILVPVILLAGIVALVTLVSLREEPVPQVLQEYAPLVSVMTVSTENRAVNISGNGVVTARTRVELVPQVGGRIISIHPSMRAGGRFSAGEELIQIEQVDYELAVIQAESEVAAAVRKLELEQAEADASVEEWIALNPDEPAPGLVARKPQISEAEANVRAAEARMRQADLNLSRTRLSMPFDGRVIRITADEGGVVMPNQAVGVVYSTEVFEIPVPLEFDELSWIRAARDDVPGSEAKIDIRIAGVDYTLIGEVARIESELDSVSRLARAIVRIRSDEIPPEARDSFIPGLFVDVLILGPTLDSVSVLPRSSVREGETAWLIEEDRLQIYPLDVVFESAGDVIVKDLPEDAIVVSSQLDVVTKGMKVRTRSVAQ
jgi:RND family efflux transporter MFP subunit